MRGFLSNHWYLSKKKKFFIFFSKTCAYILKVDFIGLGLYSDFRSLFLLLYVVVTMQVVLYVVVLVMGRGQQRDIRR